MSDEKEFDYEATMARISWLMEQDHLSYLLVVELNALSAAAYIYEEEHYPVAQQSGFD